MRLGEILDGSFNIYRRHFGLFMRLSLILVWLPTAAGIYLNLRYSSNLLELLSLVEQHLAASIGIGLLCLVVWTACSLLLKAGTIRIISDSYLGHEPELGASLRFGVDKIIPLLLVGLSKTLLLILLYLAGALVVGLMYLMGKMISPGVGGLMIFAGVIAAVWAVIWISYADGLATNNIVFEVAASSGGVMVRSLDLTRDPWGKVLGAVVVMSVISYSLPQFECAD